MLTSFDHLTEALTDSSFYYLLVDGKVYKVVQWFDEETKQGNSELLDIFDVTSPEPIRMMEISPKVECIHLI